MKALLYCQKAKPYLYDLKNIMGIFGVYNVKQINFDFLLRNGKIVAECDFEVEKIFEDNSSFGFNYITKTLSGFSLLKNSCMTNYDIIDYLGDKHGYAIHIKNLHIFEEPRELGDYYNNKDLMNYILEVWENFGLPDKDDYEECSFKKAPQNMCRAFDTKDDYILISIKPQEMCRILNDEQKVLVRKNILKGMI